MKNKQVSFIAEFNAQEKARKDIFKKVGSKKIADLISRAPALAAFVYDGNKGNEQVFVSACKMIVESVDSMMARDGRPVFCNYVVIDDIEGKKSFAAIYLFGNDLESSEEASDIIESSIRNLEEYDGPESKVAGWTWRYCSWNEILEDFPEAEIFSTSN